MRHTYLAILVLFPAGAQAQINIPDHCFVRDTNYTAMSFGSNLRNRIPESVDEYYAETGYSRPDCAIVNAGRHRSEGQVTHPNGSIGFTRTWYDNNSGTIGTLDAAPEDKLPVMHGIYEVLIGQSGTTGTGELRVLVYLPGTLLGTGGQTGVGTGGQTGEGTGSTTRPSTPSSPTPGPSMTESVETSISGFRAEDISSRFCFPLRAAEDTDTLHLGLETDDGFQMCTHAHDPNWAIVDAYASCMDGATEIELMVTTPQQMACIVGESGDWLVRISEESETE